jgi:Type IIA topoisomerase (DNA gyrase/topo II, topoisomerase IV), A subunit
VKKTRLEDYDSPRTGGLIGIKLREHADGSTDQVVAACLANDGDDLLLVSRKGVSLRFTADNDSLRPMGRAASGVMGMRFRFGDSLLTMDVVREGAQVFVVTEGGFAKRTDVSEYREQNRGGIGIKVAKITDARGDLVGALITHEHEEVLVIMESGKVMRSSVDEVSLTGRNTQGVTFSRPDDGDKIIAIARNVETELGVDDEVAA